MEVYKPSPETDKAVGVTPFTVNPFGVHETLTLWSKAMLAKNFGCSTGMANV